MAGAPTSSGWDVCLVFPCGADTLEKRKKKHNTLKEFQKVLLGLRVEKLPFKKEVHEVRNKTFVVLRSLRCFLTPDGQPYIDDIDQQQHAMTLQQVRKAEQHVTTQMKDHLEQEYIAFVGNAAPTTTRKFNQLIACTIVRRLQLSCGLSTAMKMSVDGDEIICVVRADENDLRTEAARSGYRLQLYNQPFSKPALSAVGGLGKKELHACREVLRDRVDAGAEQPQLDAGMFRDGWHEKLLRWLQQQGHNEETCNKRDGIYIAPYAPYVAEPRFEPLFRRWTTDLPNGSKHVSVFRAVDRIRLVNSIIARNINLEALQFAKLLCVGGFFALHDMTEISWFREKWALNKCLRKQPLRRIRNYFGEKVALYFAWLEFYTRSLRFPGLLGLAVFMYEMLAGELSPPAVITFSIFVCVWSTAFDQMWRRKNAFLNMWWGTIGFKQAERERPQFVGQVRYNPIDDHKEMFHPSVKKLRKRMLVASMVVFVTISIAVSATVACLALKAFMVEHKVLGGKRDAQAAGVANAVQIGVLNSLYRVLATKLTVWENHRTDSEHENQLIIKTFLFRFFNSYASFFYIGFFKQPLEAAGCLDQDCMGELRLQLASIFIAQLIAGNAAELGVPYLKYRLRLRADAKNLKASELAAATVGDGVEFETPELESKYEPYGDREAFDDNAEMVVQFGFVTLFVVAFPLAPFLAWGSNVLEQHIDAYKLCFDHKRPVPKQAESIGMWQSFLTLISRISVVTNIALIFFTTDIFAGWSKSSRWLMFMAAEHALLALKAVIEDVVPDTPLQIEMVSARHEHTVKRVFQGLQAEKEDTQACEKAEELDLKIHETAHRLVELDRGSTSTVVVNVLHPGKKSGKKKSSKNQDRTFAVAETADESAGPVCL